MWFGNLVTLRSWDGLWLNESFATYMSFLAVNECTEHETGWTYFDDHIRTWAVWQDELPTTHPIEAEVLETQGAFNNFDGITYGKGCCVLKQLAFRLGPETFRKGVAGYLERYAYANTENHDFTDALAAAAGEDLGPWCRDWLFASGVNVLRPEVAVEDGKVSRLVLRQEPGNSQGLLRRHHLRLGFLGAREASEGPLKVVSSLDVVVSGAETEVPEAVGRPAPAQGPGTAGHAYALEFPHGFRHEVPIGDARTPERPPRRRARQAAPPRSPRPWPTASRCGRNA